ncbi:MAG: hypothetical protein QOJ42_2592 [Acidobacteriaceae bacterium]|jgi:hypothetical protein|nr:hypothetical protein [Acidobacteriaceae bacterium]MDX6456747.1 hypothetical protein [Acidobacteriaceae bacterium]
MKKSSGGPTPQPSAPRFGANGLLIGAGALIVYGLTRRSKSGTALATAGGVLAFKAAKSRSSTHSSAKATFLVNASPQEAYDLWRNFENLPRFMSHLKSVRWDFRMQLLQRFQPFCPEAICPVLIIDSA